MGWKDAPEVAAAPAWQSAPEVAAPAADEPFPVKLGRQVLNAAAGTVRGAGSIGATLLASPSDFRTQMFGSPSGILPQPKTLSSLVAPATQGPTEDQQRRQAMTDALASFGADPNSLAFQGGKLGGEIAGTAGVGGAAANVLGRVLPALATRAAPVLDAIRTGGMSAGGATGLPGVAARVVGGAVNGGASAGLVDPEQAGAGAAIGAVAPGAVQLAGKAGSAIGSVLRGPEQSPALAQAVQDARAAGYVIPPTQARPTLANRVLEGFSGKLSTAQNASAKNQAVTNNLAGKALGLPPGTQITQDVLDGVRQQAGQAYTAIGGTGIITPRAGYSAALDQIEAPFKLTAGAFPNAQPSPVLDMVESLRSPAFAAASAVEKIKQLRTAADDAFRSGNTDVGRAARAGAKALEDAVEEHLQVIGQPQLLSDFRDARQLIAKTYTVEKALNQATGSVDARKLAAQVQKGKPVSGELRQAADFAGTFPKAAQPIESMGSLPQTSPLDWFGAGGASAVTGNPLLMAGVVARPAARAAVLSPVVQNRLVQPPASAIGRLLGSPEFQQAVLRAAPATAADR